MIHFFVKARLIIKDIYKKNCLILIIIRQSNLENTINLPFQQIHFIYIDSLLTSEKSKNYC